ncbi:MAG: hypothetical protein WD225_07425 [Ilumatobacteraceae bacterium]
MKKVLVVANRTLCEQHLLDEIDRHRSEGPVAFHVLVPAAASAWRWAMAGPDAVGWNAIDAELDPLAEASGRLESLLDTLAVAGVAATGEVREAGPVAAVDAVMVDQSFDEVIVSTLPQGISRWWRGDVIERIRSRTGLPVTHIVPDQPAPDP